MLANKKWTCDCATGETEAGSGQDYTHEVTERFEVSSRMLGMASGWSWWFGMSQFENSNGNWCVCVCVCFPPLQASHLSVHFHPKDALYVHNFGYCRNELSGITFGFEKSLPCIRVLPLELKRVAMRNSSIVCDLKVEAVQGNLLNFCLLQCTGENGPSACLTTAKTWKAYARYSRCS